MTASKKALPALVRITTHVPREVALEIMRLADSRQISLSACTAALLGEQLQADVEHRHAALLEAAIERAVSRHLGRIADMSFRAALASDEGRRLVLHMLIGQEGIDKARGVRREAHSAAWQRLGEPPPTPPESMATAWRNGQAAS